MIGEDRATPRLSPTAVVRLVQDRLDALRIPSLMDYARAGRAVVGAAELLGGLGAEPWMDPNDPPDRLADRGSALRGHPPATLTNRGAIPRFDPAKVLDLVRVVLTDRAIPILLDNERAAQGAAELLRAIGVAPWTDPAEEGDGPLHQCREANIGCRAGNLRQPPVSP